MSLYYDASKFIISSGPSGGSLKSRVFSDKSLKSPPAQIYALVSEARKWAPVLKEVVENSSLLTQERKLTPALALLLVHDLLFSKKGIAAPSGHKLRVAVEKHKARLHAELTKARLRHRCATIEELKSHLESSSNAAAEAQDGLSETWPHPRWVRINRIKTTLEEQLSTTFADYELVDTLQSLLRPPTTIYKPRLYVDKHIPDLLALNPSADLSRSLAYLSGALILQDKASCFPAYLLDPQPSDDLVIDACAAPGNKTTHLASLLYPLTRASNDTHKPSIVACERDKTRAQTLTKMIQTAAAEEMVQVEAGQDFLRTDPNVEPWCRAGALLLDPSCSGSGIIGRDEVDAAIELPSFPSDGVKAANSKGKGKKRKRGIERPAADATMNLTDEKPLEYAKSQAAAEATAEERPDASVSVARLASLSAFQVKLVEHALRFPRATRVTYSTCSIHDEENEHVIARVLASEVAQRRGWRILKREDQVDGMRKWDLRGQKSTFRSEQASLDRVLEVPYEMAEACIRCEKGTAHGTQGFFVAGFVRSMTDGNNNKVDGAEDSTSSEAMDEEWAGFEDN